MAKKKEEGFTVGGRGDDITISLGDNTKPKRRRLQAWVKVRGKDEYIDNPG